MATDTITASTFILEQHQEIRRHFASVGAVGPKERRSAFEPLVRLLAVHETAEEMVIYPALERSGAQGAAIAAARKGEEDAAKKALADLEALDPAESGFMAKFLLFQRDVEAHAEAEEREVLPMLERISDPAQLEDMARKLQVAGAMAPTHAHRSAPESATGNLLVGPFVAMTDRIRDALRDLTR
jgi:hemerythrin superfamily protein